MAQQWTFLSNHGRVLLVIAADPDVRLRDVADSVGITERAVQMIVADLEDAGFISRQRVGRRNHYVVDAAQHFRHPHEAGHRVGELLDLFNAQTTAPQTAPSPNGSAPAPSATAPAVTRGIAGAASAS